MCVTNVVLVTSVVDVPDLHGIKGRNIEDLSGGELQRFAIAIVCVQRADV